MTATIIFTAIGVILLISAYFPEFTYNYRHNKLVATNDLTAAVARQLTRLSIQYHSQKKCYVAGLLLSKKALLLIISYTIIAAICAIIIAFYPWEMPYLLSIVMAAFMWVGMGCEIMLKCQCRFIKSVYPSLLFAILLPPCIFAILHFVLPIIHPEYSHLL